MRSRQISSREPIKTLMLLLVTMSICIIGIIAVVRNDSAIDRFGVLAGSPLRDPDILENYNILCRFYFRPGRGDVEFPDTIDFEKKS